MPLNLFLYNGIKTTMKTMTSLRMDAKLKKKISQIAAERNRSFSNLVETVLMKYVESKKKKNARKPFAETENP